MFLNVAVDAFTALLNIENKCEAKFGVSIIKKVEQILKHHRIKWQLIPKLLINDIIINNRSFQR